MLEALNDPGYTRMDELLLMEETLVIEHAKRMKAERVLATIAHSQRASADQLRKLAIEYLEAA